jgi:hypothetical protein
MTRKRKMIDSAVNETNETCVHASMSVVFTFFTRKLTCLRSFEYRKKVAMYTFFSFSSYFIYCIVCDVFKFTADGKRQNESTQGKRE